MMSVGWAGLGMLQSCTLQRTVATWRLAVVAGNLSAFRVAVLFCAFSLSASLGDQEKPS